MAVGFVIVIVVAAGVWGVELLALVAHPGVGITFDILYVLFGALLLVTGIGANAGTVMSVLLVGIAVWVLLRARRERRSEDVR
jgi:hypothetical protein